VQSRHWIWVFSCWYFLWLGETALHHV